MKTFEKLVVDLEQSVTVFRAAFMARRLQRAKEYAAEALARNVKPNGCAHCANLEKLAEVQRVVANYKPFSAIRSADHV